MPDAQAVEPLGYGQQRQQRHASNARNSYDCAVQRYVGAKQCRYGYEPNRSTRQRHNQRP